METFLQCFYTRLPNVNSVFLRNKKILIQNFPQDSLRCTLKQISPTQDLIMESRVPRNAVPDRPPTMPHFRSQCLELQMGTWGVFYKISASEDQPRKKGRQIGHLSKLSSFPWQPPCSLGFCFPLRKHRIARGERPKGLTKKLPLSFNELTLTCF